MARPDGKATGSKTDGNAVPAIPGMQPGVWVIVSLAGTGFGIALSSSLISVLR